VTGEKDKPSADKRLFRESRSWFAPEKGEFAKLENWSPSKGLDARYTVGDVQVLVANARRALIEYSPLTWSSPDGSERIYRRIPYGEDLDVLVLDMRSHRAGNGCNVERRRDRRPLTSGANNSIG